MAFLLWSRSPRIGQFPPVLPQQSAPPSLPLAQALHPEAPSWHPRTALTRAMHKITQHIPGAWQVPWLSRPWQLWSPGVTWQPGDGCCLQAHTPVVSIGLGLVMDRQAFPGPSTAAPSLSELNRMCIVLCHVCFPLRQGPGLGVIMGHHHALLLLRAAPLHGSITADPPAHLSGGTQVGDVFIPMSQHPEVQPPDSVALQSESSVS